MTRLNIKNVILYDQYAQVVGFVELKNHAELTEVKVKHNLDVGTLMVTIVAGDKHNFEMVGKTFSYNITQAVNLDGEVFVTLGDVASGVINPKTGGVPCEPLEKPQGKAVGALKSILEDTNKAGIVRDGALVTNAAREIDEVLRAVCSINAQGKGMCEQCPYREFFYGEPACEEVDKIIPITYN